MAEPVPAGDGLRPPGQAENTPLDRKVEAIRRIRNFERSDRSNPKYPTELFQFIGRLCTQTDLSSVIDPDTFRVPLTDTITLGVQRVEVKESLPNVRNPNPKSKEVTIPVFDFGGKLGIDMVMVDGKNADGPNSIRNQDGGKAFMGLYHGQDNIDYYKAFKESLRRGYDQLPQLPGRKYSFPNPTGLLMSATGKFLAGQFVGQEMSKIWSLNKDMRNYKQEIVKRFMQAIDPTSVNKPVVQ